MLPWRHFGNQLNSVFRRTYNLPLAGTASFAYRFRPNLLYSTLIHNDSKYDKYLPSLEKSPVLENTKYKRDPFPGLIIPYVFKDFPVNPGYKDNSSIETILDQDPNNPEALCVTIAQIHRRKMNKHKRKKRFKKMLRDTRVKRVQLSKTKNKEVTKQIYELHKSLFGIKDPTIKHTLPPKPVRHR